MDGARAAFGPRLATAPPNTLPWSVIALTATTSPVRRQWVNAWGETVDLDEVVERALRLLEEASLPLARAMREGKAETAQAPVHGFTCGGTHMLYAVLTAMHAGYTGKDRPARVQQQVDILVWRLSAEVEFIERFYRTRPTSAIAGWYQLDTKLKLLGHAEECLAFATRHKVAQLTAAQRTQWKDAGVALRRILGELEGTKAGGGQGLGSRAVQAAGRRYLSCAARVDAGMSARRSLTRSAAAALLSLSALGWAGSAASQGTSETPAASTDDVQVLRERVATFWAARMAGDPSAQWGLLEPRGRGRLTAQEYGAGRSAVRYLAYQVENATVDGYFAVVKVRLMFQPILPSGRRVGVQSSLAEDYWVKIGGTWYRRLDQEPLQRNAS